MGARGLHALLRPLRRLRRPAAGRPGLRRAGAAHGALWPSASGLEVAARRRGADAPQAPADAGWPAGRGRRARSSPAMRPGARGRRRRRRAPDPAPIGRRRRDATSTATPSVQAVGLDAGHRTARRPGRPTSPMQPALGGHAPVVRTGWATSLAGVFVAGESPEPGGAGLAGAARSGRRPSRAARPRARRWAARRRRRGHSAGPDAVGLPAGLDAGPDARQPTPRSSSASARR